MKTKIFSILSVALMMFATSCEPGEDRYVLDNSFDPNVELNFDHEFFDGVEGSNKLTLKMNTPGVMGTWNYGVGTKQSNEVTFTYPAAGTATFTFTVENQYIAEDGTVTSGYSYNYSVDITNMNVPLDQNYYNLCGEDTAAGKVWVFDGAGGDPMAGGPWYGNGPTDKSSYLTVWWKPNGEWCPELGGEMKFDLDGGANLSKTTNGVTSNGTFMFNTDFSQLTTSGTTILGGDMFVPAANVVDICKLTETELHIHSSNYNGGGWTWLFKAKE